MKIIIETIPQSQHRYETTGDYWTEEDGTIQIRVTDMGNKDYEFFVAIHELVEQFLVDKRGITDEAITNFDIEFEKNAGPTDEPGDIPNAPYQNEHCFATGIERMICAISGVKWDDYEKAVYTFAK